MYILGGLNDQIALLVWGTLSTGFFKLPEELMSYGPYREMFSWLLSPQNSTSPLLEFLLSTFLSVSGPNGVILLSILFTLVTFIASYQLFKKYKYGLLLSLVFTFSSYYWSHLGIHLSLMQTWIFPVSFLVFEKYVFSGQKVNSYLQLMRNSLVVALNIAVSLLFSNYLGFFLVIFFSIYTFSYVIAEYRYFKILQTRALLIYIFSLFFALLIVLPFFSPYLKINYSSKSTTEQSSYKVTRPMEDFFYFSSRPWYFFIPPVKNPWLGTISSNLIDSISRTGYFLADDYSAVEHSGNYFGYSFLVLSIILYVLYLRFIKIAEERSKVFQIILTMLALTAFSMPPYFTVSEKIIWTPGYLIYLLFPMFRSTSRLSVVILMCFLVLLAMLFKVTNDHASQKIKSILAVIFPLFLCITLFETYIPPKLKWVGSPPEVYVALNQVSAPKSKFMVYPYKRSEDAFFWLSVHRRFLVNINLYHSNLYESESLTEKLPSKEGLAAAKNLDVDYVVVFTEAAQKDLLFFSNSSNLELVKEFSNSIIYKVL